MRACVCAHAQESQRCCGGAAHAHGPVLVTKDANAGAQSVLEEAIKRGALVSAVELASAIVHAVQELANV